MRLRRGAIPTATSRSVYLGGWSNKKLFKGPNLDQLFSRLLIRLLDVVEVPFYWQNGLVCQKGSEHALIQVLKDKDTIEISLYSRDVTQQSHPLWRYFDQTKCPYLFFRVPDCWNRMWRMYPHIGSIWIQPSKSGAPTACIRTAHGKEIVCISSLLLPIHT